MITGYRAQDFIEMTEVSPNDILPIVDGSNKQMKQIKVSNLVGSVSSVEWDSVVHKPSDIVRDANYVHTDNNYSPLEKTKLGNIEAEAQVNVVLSVASKVGDVLLDKSDVGLGNVDNTSDISKPLSTATLDALSTKVDKETGKQLSAEDYTSVEKNKLSGIEDGSNLYIKPLSETISYIDGLQIELDSKVAQEVGKQLSSEDYTALEKTKLSGIEANANLYIRPTSENISYIDGLQTALDSKLETETLTSLVKVGNELRYSDEQGATSSIDLSLYLDDTNLSRITSGVYDSNTKTLVFTRDDSSTFSVDSSMFFDDTNLVTSVASKTGVVILDKSDVGLSQVDDTSDINKPLSTATQNALAEKVDSVVGKQLSTEDYTTTEKTKLSGIEDGANLYTKPTSEPISYIEGLQNALDSKMTSETLTTLSMTTNMLSYTDEVGLTTSIDFSSYLDYTNTITSVDGMVGDVILADLYEPKNASLLKTSDIGVTTQPYNIHTVIDSVYVHTDNNYTNEDKAIIASFNPLLEVTTTNTVTLTNKTLDSYTNVIGADNVHYRAKNDTQSILTKGTIIKSNGYVNGEDAIAVVPTTSSNDVAIGIVKNDIPIGGYGLVINAGVISDIDTSGYPVNAILYRANGAFTPTKPTTQFYQACGFVLRSNQNTGSMLVEFTNPNVNVMRYNFVSSQDQTSFPVDCILIYPMVYVDGLLKTLGYSVSNNTVEFAIPLNVGVEVNIIEYYNVVVN